MTASAVVLTTLPLFHVTGMQRSMNAPIFQWKQHGTVEFAKYVK
jgi:hypothetical protein